MRTSNAIIFVLCFLFGVNTLLASDYIRIKNRWMKDGKTEYKINIQNTTVDAGAVEPNWWSADWELEKIGSSEFYHIKNRWQKDGKTTYCLHNQNGKIEASSIQPGWWSAQWKLMPVGDGKHYRIQNRWYPNRYLHTQNTSLEVGTIQNNWWSAQWELEGFKLTRTTTPLTPSTPLAPRPKPMGQLMNFVHTENRESGVKTFVYESVNNNIPLANVEGNQKPQMFLNLAANVGVYHSQRYINISTTGSRVAATSNGMLIKDQEDIRGWYLEYVDVQIESLTPGFTLSSYGPSTDMAEGSVSSTSGVNLSTGASISSEGPGVGMDLGFNFGMSYTSNLKAFTVRDNSSYNTVKTRTKLSSSNVSETWSNPKGGDAPYSNSNDLLRTDAAGQFSGTPLNYLPELAKSNLPLSSIGTFKAPNNFTGMANFKVTIKMHLCKVEKTNKVFTVERKTAVKDYSVERIYSVDFNH